MSTPKQAPVTVTFQASPELNAWLNRQAIAREVSKGTFIKLTLAEARARDALESVIAGRDEQPITVRQARRLAGRAAR